MRASLRLLANAKYLTPGAPTGLTGLFTHPAPRSALVYLYSATLDKLATLPKESVYRTATEALTKQRLAIVESVKPEGFEAWQQRVNKVVEEHPDVFAKNGTYMMGKHVAENFNGRLIVTSRVDRVYDHNETEWDGEAQTEGELEGARTLKERASQRDLGDKRPVEEQKTVELEEEPMLTAEQVGQIENQINAGLIEEVIQVAQNELELVDVMAKAKIWEDLEEKPVEGQWTYFERTDASTGPAA